MLATHVRTSRLGRQSFSDFRGRVGAVGGSHAVDGAASVSPEIAAIPPEFCGTQHVEWISFTSCSTYARSLKQEGKSGCGSCSDGVLLIVMRQAFFVSFQARSCTPRPPSSRDRKST